MWNEGEVAADGHQDTIMCLCECVHSPSPPPDHIKGCFYKGENHYGMTGMRGGGGRQISGSQFPH